VKTEILTACDQVIAALANGVYQGAILTLLVGVGLKWFGRSNAATRHGVWLATLVLLLAIIPAHYFLEQRSQAPAGEDVRNSAIRSVSTSAPGPQSGPAGTDVPWLSRPLDFEYGPFKPLDQAGPEAPLVLLSEQPGIGSSNHTYTETTLTPTVAVGPMAPVHQESSPRPSRLLQPLTWNLASRLKVPRLTGAVLVGVFSAVAALRMALLIRRLYQLQRLKAGSMPARQEVEDLFQRLTRQLALGRRVLLRVSPVQRSPVVLGFLPPMVLLPASEAARPDTAGTEQILRHELAHVQRGDDWANLIQHCIQAAFFFHPAVWWISRRLVLEREIACDDHVLEQGGRRRAYALLLAELAHRITRCPPWPVPGAFSNKSQLTQRINMILDTRRNTSPRLAKTRLGFIMSAAAVLAVLALYSAPRLVLAQAQTAVTGVSPLSTLAASAGTANELAGVLPPQPVAEVALVESEPDTPSIPDEDSGPRFKPGRPGAYARQPALVAPPAPPGQPAMPAPANLFAAPVSPGPFALGKVYAQAPSKPDDVEQRLERLERMVQSLMAERRPKAAQSGDWDSASVNQQEIQKFKEKSDREAARAAQQAKIAAERASRDMERAMKEKNAWALDMNKESSEKQLEAMRQARQDLQREMQRLDSDIRRLEQEQRRMEQEHRRLEQDQPKPAPYQRGRTKSQKDQTSSDSASEPAAE
jgi:beta-lactamase regulating signal transducer with metallopeptidase domain